MGGRLSPNAPRREATEGDQLNAYVKVATSLRPDASSKPITSF
jgi:hypothetical protein